MREGRRDHEARSSGAARGGSGAGMRAEAPSRRDRDDTAEEEGGHKRRRGRTAAKSGADADADGVAAGIENGDVDASVPGGSEGVPPQAVEEIAGTAAVDCAEGADDEGDAGLRMKYEGVDDPASAPDDENGGAAHDTDGGSAHDVRVSTDAGGNGADEPNGEGSSDDKGGSDGEKHERSQDRAGGGASGGKGDAFDGEPQATKATGAQEPSEGNGGGVDADAEDGIEMRNAEPAPEGDPGVNPVMNGSQEALLEPEAGDTHIEDGTDGDRKRSTHDVPNLSKAIFWHTLDPEDAPVVIPQRARFRSTKRVRTDYASFVAMHTAGPPPKHLDNKDAGMEDGNVEMEAAVVAAMPVSKKARIRKQKKKSPIMDEAETELAFKLFELADAAAAASIQEEEEAGVRLPSGKKRASKGKGKGAKGAKGAVEDFSAMQMDILGGVPGAAGWPGADQASQFPFGAAQYGASQNFNPTTLAMWQQAFARMNASGATGPAMADDPANGMYSLHALQQQQQQIQQSQMQLQRRACMPRCAAHVYIAHFIDYQQKLAQQILFSQQYQYAMNMYANKPGYPSGPTSQDGALTASAAVLGALAGHGLHAAVGVESMGHEQEAAGTTAAVDGAAKGSAPPGETNNGDAATQKPHAESEKLEENPQGVESRPDAPAPGTSKGEQMPEGQQRAKGDEAKGDAVVGKVDDGNHPAPTGDVQAHHQQQEQQQQQQQQEHNIAAQLAEHIQAQAAAMGGVQNQGDAHQQPQTTNVVQPSAQDLVTQAHLMQLAQLQSMMYSSMMPGMSQMYGHVGYGGGGAAVPPEQMAQYLQGGGMNGDLTGAPFNFGAQKGTHDLQQQAQLLGMQMHQHETQQQQQHNATDQMGAVVHGGQTPA